MEHKIQDEPTKAVKPHWSGMDISHKSASQGKWTQLQDYWEQIDSSPGLGVVMM